MREHDCAGEAVAGSGDALRPHPTRRQVEVTQPTDGEILASLIPNWPGYTSEPGMVPRERGAVVSDLTERIIAVLREHEYASPIERSHPWARVKRPAGCEGCDWEASRSESGQNGRDQHAAHVAERVAEALADDVERQAVAALIEAHSHEYDALLVGLSESVVEQQP